MSSAASSTLWRRHDGRRRVSESPCILVVEGDVLIRQPICAYLRECGYLVLEAASTDEASLILNKGKAIVDIILADVNAPGSINGFALAVWLRTNRPAIKVLLAGSVATATAEAADLCEDGPRLTRPYDRQILLDRIKRSLAARSQAGN